MANQSPDRRQVLEMMAIAAAASQFVGFSRWMCAPLHAETVSAAQKAAAYKPLFFTPAEYATIDQLTELIIPRDESPGARDAGVSEFIDFMAANDPEIQRPFRDGIAWLNARAAQAHGAEFMKLSEDRQTELLRELASRNPSPEVDKEGPTFFRLVRRYTVMGYYTSRIGMEQLDYPGLKVYSESPACPHKDDPEHEHLPPPRY
jgi:gluconate 2-dehydrogenase gamma chain